MVPLLKFKTSIYHCNFPTVASLRTQCQVKTIMAELKRSANAAITALAMWWICELFRKDKFSCLESEFNWELKQRRRQQERRKTKQQICTCIMLLSMLLDYNVEFHSNAHVVWQAWTRDRNFLFFSWTYSPLEFSSRKIPQHLTNRIRVLKFATRIQFSGAVFAAFAFAVV